MNDLYVKQLKTKIVRRHTFLLAALVWTAFPLAWAGTLQGTALYRERIALPPHAVFEAQLQDISRADAPAVILGSVMLDPAGNPPFRFEISYEDTAIMPGHRYAVRATISDQDALLFTTDTNYPVFTDNAEPLIMTLVSARNKNPSQNNSPAIDLRGTYWKLVRLDGSAVESGEKQPEPHLIFAIDQQRLSGNSGCNRILGSFELEGDTIHFSQLAGTMMACLDGMALEQQFLQALTKIERYTIQGSQLKLFDNSGTLVAEFEAKPLT